jgi:hypothetical protein
VRRSIGWVLFLGEPLLRRRVRVLAARVFDVAVVFTLANAMVVEWAAHRLAGEGDREDES